MGDLYLKPARSSSNLLRGLSQNIWSHVPLTQINNGAIDEGFGFVDDLLSFNDEGPWVVSNATTGTAVLADAKGGVLFMDSGAAADDQGVQIQYGGATGADSFIPNANSKIYFEARLKLTTIGAGTFDFFLGLSETDTSIITGSANTSSDYIGIQSITADLLAILVTENDGSLTAGGTAHTFVDGEYVKLGFVVDGVSSITPYVNGVAGDKITTNIAVTKPMTPSVVVQSAGTTQTVGSVDWIACYQVEQITN